MNKRTAATLLALTIILVGGLRLTFALSEPSLAYEGYETLRLTEHIAQNALPLQEDPLSYGGRERAYSPLYHYLLAPFTLLLGGVLALKVLPNILYLTAIPLVYLIGYEVSNNRTASVIAAFIAGLTPITFSSYINDANTDVLAIILLLTTLYALIRPQQRLPLLITAGVALGLASPLSFILVAGLATFLIITALEKLHVSDTYPETLFFFLFFSLWSALLFYKEAFLEAGIAAPWAYIPQSILSEYYAAFNMVTAISMIGALTVLLGGLAAYHALFSYRNRRALLIVGLGAAAIIALLLRIIPLETGIIILTFTLCILAARGLGLILSYLSKTREPRTRYVVITSILFFFLFASAIPALSEAASQVRDTPTQEHHRAAQWLSTQQATLLTTPKEGAFFQQQGVATFTDRSFLLSQDPEERYQATQEIYRSRFALSALERINKHAITHVLLSDVVRREYARNELLFTPHECFEPVYEESTITIYEVRCDVRTI